MTAKIQYNFQFNKFIGKKVVYCRAKKVPVTDSEAFDGSNINKATLHVPEASVSDYKAASPWSQFKEIVPMDVEAIDGDANGDEEVNVADIDFVIERIGEALNDSNKAADVNTDGDINVADVDYIIERIK